jgi:hypothetical protein
VKVSSTSVKPGSQAKDIESNPKTKFAAKMQPKSVNSD